MKKKTLIIIFSVILFALVVNVSFGHQKTVEEVFFSSNVNNMQILHKEVLPKGTIIFSTDPQGNTLYTAILKRGLTGYKVVYSGIQGDIKKVTEKFGVSSNFFPSIEKTEMPIYFGIIGDPKVKNVRILEKKRNIEKDTYIINKDQERLWFVDMDDLQGSGFQIVTYDESGAELKHIEGDISPYTADGKPLKGYNE